MASLKFMSCIKCLTLGSAVVIAAIAAFLYSGLYPMGADDHHNKLTHWVLETLREQSIVRAAKDIVVPEDLQTPARLLAGGADYNDMCSGCHLKPGKTESDFTQGLYPAPPDLTQASHADPEGAHSEADADARVRRYFWVIKHGVKASGMPAWGAGHDDERIWNMVAFIDRLSELSPQQYQILTARGDQETGHH